MVDKTRQAQRCCELDVHLVEEPPKTEGNASVLERSKIDIGLVVFQTGVVWGWGCLRLKTVHDCACSTEMAHSETDCVRVNARQLWQSREY